MKQLVPREKQSKKAQREANSQQRNVWTINPVTRIKSNGKAYDRKRLKKELKSGDED